MSQPPSKARQLRGSLCASFLEDEDPTTASTPPTEVTTDLADASDDTSSLGKTQSPDCTPEGVDAWGHASKVSSRRLLNAIAASDSMPDHRGGITAIAEDDEPDDDDEPSDDEPRGDVLGGLQHQPSLKTILASEEAGTNSEELNPHALAARVASGVADNFQQSLPTLLKHEFRNRDTLAPFQSKEMVLGPLLGSGEFSHVYEVKAFKPSSKLMQGVNVLVSDDKSGSAEDVRLTKEEHDQRVLMKARERFRDSKNASYAVKHLRPQLVDKYSVLDYAQAAADLAQEAQFLGCLVHPNIIKIRGISAAGPAGFANGAMGYFLIIDRLNETLDGRIRHWQKQRRKKKGFGNKLKKKMLQRFSSDDNLADSVESNRAATEEEWGFIDAQLDVGLQISSALQYMHKRNIMFRDLKPENVGFDVRGDVKIFDFGLSTIVPSNGDPYEDTFEMSGAGSPRYMAPEVLADPPNRYNLKADIYTFGIVLWEILSLEKPYGFVRGRDELISCVVEENVRPPISDCWPETIRDVIEQSFDQDYEQRPKIQTFYNTLRFQLREMSGDDARTSRRFIERRRSSTSMRGLLSSVEEQDAESEDGDGSKSRGVFSKMGLKLPKRRVTLSAGNLSNLSRSAIMRRPTP